MHTLRRVIQRLNLISAPSDALVLDVAVTMSEGRVGAIPIMDDGRLVGIFSERDLMTRVVVSGRDPRATRISDVMTHDVVTASLDDTVDSCVDKMRAADCRHLDSGLKGSYLCVPIVAHSEILGVLHIRTDQPIKIEDIV